MRTAEFDYELPQELIAQTPAVRRDESRLLVLHRATGRIEHRHFRSLLEYLRPDDVLVLNNSKVIPARLRGSNSRTGGRFEILLLEENSPNDWWAMLRPGKRARIGTEIEIKGSSRTTSRIKAVVTQTNSEGHRRLRFDGPRNISEELDALGEIPLPPYIRRESATSNGADRERYQTVYADKAGSIAAPTAGLHFTPELLNRVRAMGIRICFVTLHVGLGTFAPVKAEKLDAHEMHEERFGLGADDAIEIAAKINSGGRVVAVGTTTVRVLESIAAAHDGGLKPGAGRTRIFIHPPYRFRAVGALLTNFHLPRSTLLMLASAFAAEGETTRGRDLMLSAYEEAVREQYRFFSYGDAMLIL